MTDGVSKRRAFIARPWNNQAASLYPYVMDGVEYIDQVLSLVQSVLREKDFTAEFDKNTFVTGLSLRDNLLNSLRDADLFIALLDGLRPNVVYEIGLAQGIIATQTTGSTSKPTIFYLVEKNATVLVRNYFTSPKNAPTTTGQPATILNPKLNVSDFFSDLSGVFQLTYDRLNLESSLREQLERAIDRFFAAHASDPTGAEIVEATEEPDEETDEPVETTAAAATVGDNHEAVAVASKGSLNLKRLYRQGSYERIVALVTLPHNYEEGKFLALSLMRLNRVSEAVPLWKNMIEESPEKPGNYFHLGVCFFVLRQYEAALYYLNLSKNKGDIGSRCNDYISRIQEKIASLGAQFKPADHGAA